MGKPQISFLYTMGIEGGPTKIGRSAFPLRRAGQVQRSEADPVTITGTWPIKASIAPAAERYVHFLLRTRHFRGEWFDVTQAEAEAAIRTALDARGYDPRHLVPSIRPPGRPKVYAQSMQARFPEGTFARIAAMLHGPEDRTDFVRAAVERELAARERAARRQAKAEDLRARGQSRLP